MQALPLVVVLKLARVFNCYPKTPSGAMGAYIDDAGLC